MSSRTTALGALAVVAAFAAAYALGNASRERAIADAPHTTTITVDRNLPLIPSLAMKGALPELAKTPARRRRPKASTALSPRKGHAPQRLTPPQPPAPRSPFSRPQTPAPAPQTPRPNRPYDEPEYELPAPQATPVPTAIVAPEPDQVEEMPEDGTPE